MKEIRRMMNEMVIKIDNAHFDIRRHERKRFIVFTLTCILLVKSYH